MGAIFPKILIRCREATGVGFSETVIALGGHTRRFSRMGVRATDVFFAL